jgi:hypothetical protein
VTSEALAAATPTANVSVWKGWKIDPLFVLLPFTGSTNHVEHTSGMTGWTCDGSTGQQASAMTIGARERWRYMRGPRVEEGSGDEVARAALSLAAVPKVLLSRAGRCATIASR